MQRRALAATRRGQKRAKALMFDDCTIERPDGDPVFDPATGKDTQPMLLVYPSEAAVAAGQPGRCKIQPFNTQTQESTSAEHQYTVDKLLLKLPIGTTVQPGDIATVTRSTLSPDLEGRTFRLIGREHTSTPTAARWTAELVTS